MSLYSHQNGKGVEKSPKNFPSMPEHNLGNVDIERRAVRMSAAEYLVNIVTINHLQDPEPLKQPYMVAPELMNQQAPAAAEIVGQGAAPVAMQQTVQMAGQQPTEGNGYALTA